MRCIDGYGVVTNEQNSGDEPNRQHGSFTEVPTCRSASVSPHAESTTSRSDANNGFGKQNNATKTSFVFFAKTRFHRTQGRNYQ